MHDIVKFERDNSHISINVFGYEDSEYDFNKEIYPVRITTYKDRTNHINLLRLTDDESNESITA